MNNEMKILWKETVLNQIEDYTDNFLEKLKNKFFHNERFQYMNLYQKTSKCEADVFRNLLQYSVKVRNK
jgi:hypothetical protein